MDKKLLVYPLDITPCFYVKKKTLEGSGLRDSDLTKAFARMLNIHRGTDKTVGKLGSSKMHL